MKKPKEPVSLKSTLILTLIASCLLGVSKCEDKPKGAPDLGWSPKIYATDSKARIILRGSERISTSSPRFDEFICIKSNEVEKAYAAYYKVLNACEKWKGETFENIERDTSVKPDSDY